MAELHPNGGMGLGEKHANFLLQRLLEHTPDTIYFKDRQSRFILVNPAATQFFKLQSAEEAIGKTDFDFFTAEHATAALADEQEIIRTGVPLLNKEEKETWQDGTITWATTTKIALRDSSANIIGTFGISRNVTERVFAIQQIAEQAALLEIASDAIMVCDLEFRIVFWNKGAELVYGWSREEALGRTAWELLFPKRSRDKQDEIFRSILSEGTWQGEVQHETKEGHPLIIESRRTLVRNVSGQPQSVLIINTDVTRLRKLMARSANARRLESIGTLATGIAHDLNNVLAPILSSIELLKLSAGESEKKIIGSLENSAKRGAAIVQQVLSSARGMEGERVPVSLERLFDEIEEVVSNTFPKNIDLKIRVPAHPWIVRGDFTQLYQVLLNFCINARDAMPQGGRLILEAENRRIDEHDTALSQAVPTGLYVLVSATDTGAGMKPEVVDKIFDPFFTTKSIGKGTGLGLSTTMGIIKKHGGFIHVYSAIGQGSTFKVYLPAEASDEKSLPSVPPQTLHRGQGETILVVDDDDSVREVTHDLLENFGYRVLTANNGAEAVDLYQQSHAGIAAVLTDMSMPVMDGLSTIQALNKINPRVRIIAAQALAPHDEFYHRLLNPYASDTANFATNWLKSNSQTALYDSVLVPALATIQRDQINGRLEKEQYATILQEMRDLIDEIGDRPVEPSKSKQINRSPQVVKHLFQFRTEILGT